MSRGHRRVGGPGDGVRVSGREGRAPGGPAASRAIRLLVLAASVLVLAACGDGPGPPEGVVEWEGIPLQEARVEPFGPEGAGGGAGGGEDAGARGAVPGPEASPFAFGRVGGVARDASGRTAVVATAADEIRIFGPDDAFRFAFGSSGEARGELLGPCCPAFGPDGLLWVRDRGNARYQAFEVGEEGAEVRRTLAIRHSAPTLWAPTTFDDRGRLVDAGLMVEEETRGTRPVRAHMNRDTGELEGVSGLPQPPPERMGRASVTGMLDGRESTFYVYQPHGPRALLAHGPDGRWAEAASDTYAVRVAGPDGAVREIVGPGMPGPALTETERVEARAVLDDYRERLSLEEEEVPFDVPARKPPLRALWFDGAGRLWVELNTAGDRRVAHVYAPDGTPEARYTWPEEVLLDVRAWVGRDEAMGVSADSAGAAGAAGAAGGAGTTGATGATGATAPSPVERVMRLRLPAPGRP